jgi:hypothetical protein
MLKKEVKRVWTGFMWLRIGTSGGLLWTQQCTFNFHETRRISWIAVPLLTSQEGLCSMELGSHVTCVVVLKHNFTHFTFTFDKCVAFKLSKWNSSIVYWENDHPTYREVMFVHHRKCQRKESSKSFPEFGQSDAWRRRTLWYFGHTRKLVDFDLVQHPNIRSSAR